MTELICIVCPKGCHLRVDEENDCRVTGNACPRGEAYGRTELKSPTRVLTSTVKITGGLHRRLPVKTDGPIPKPLLLEAVKLLDGVELRSPVHTGQIVVENLLGTGVNVVATREL